MSEIRFMEGFYGITICGLIILTMFLYSSLQAKKEKIRAINSKVRRHSEVIYGLTDATVVFRYDNFSKKQKELITSQFDGINKMTEHLLKEIEDYSKEPEKI